MFNKITETKDRLDLALTKIRHRAVKVEYAWIGTPERRQRIKLITPRPLKK